jgi:predicted amidohydrolase
MAVNPWGEVLVEGGEHEELLTASMDMDMVADARRKIPILRDRRPDVY